jgi:sugar lactone lactonase YvrE
MINPRRPSRVFSPWMAVCLLTLGSAFAITAHAAQPPVHARLPLERIATGFRDLRGLAWGPDGALYAADREAGVVYRIAPADGGGAQVTVRQAGLHRPMGLAWTPDGVLLVVEAGGGRAPGDGRVLRLNGTPEPIWTGLKQPTWLAVAPEGTLYLTAEGLRESGGRRGGGWGSAAALLLRRGPGATDAQVLATDLVEPGGLVVEPDGRILLSVERLRHQGEWRGPTLIRVDPTRPPGDRERLTVVLGSGFLNPAGLAVDALGGMLFGAQSYAWLQTHHPDWREGLDLWRGALFRLRPGGGPTALVTGLSDLRALAFDPQGHLYLATDDTLYRLRAPAPPTLDGVPPYTNQPVLPVRGRAAPGAAITLRNAGEPVVVPADPETGRFDALLPLTANRRHHVQVYATSLAGGGLPSIPAEATVVSDTRLPTVSIAGLSAPFIRGVVSLTANATDAIEGDEAWSGIKSLALLRDGQIIAQGTNSTPESGPSFSVTADWNSTEGPDGVHTLTAKGIDWAENAAHATLNVTVDNMPPVIIVRGLADNDIVRGTVEVTIIATDPTSGVASISALLDNLPRASGLGPTLTFELNVQRLTSGPHRLLVTAMDLAGNASTIPVTFIVQNLEVRVATPKNDDEVPIGSLVVRGEVEANGQVIGVTVNGYPAVVHGMHWAAVVPIEEGTIGLTAVATTQAGARAMAYVAIRLKSAPTGVMTLVANPTGGLAPLTVRFDLSGVPERVVSHAFDPIGNRTPDTIEGEPRQLQATYTTAGIYMPTLTLIDDRGAQYQASTLVQVHDKAAISSQLRGQWDMLVGALADGKLPKALEAIAEGKRTEYAAVLQALGADLPAILSTIGPVSLTRVTGDMVEGVVQRTYGGKTYLHFLYWAPDSDGIWRIIGM